MADANEEASGVVDVVGTTETDVVVEASAVVASPESKEPKSPDGATVAEASVLEEGSAEASLPASQVEVEVEVTMPSPEGDEPPLLSDDDAELGSVAAAESTGSEGVSADTGDGGADSEEADVDCESVAGETEESAELSVELSASDVGSAADSWAELVAPPSLLSLTAASLSAGAASWALSAGVLSCVSSAGAGS